MHDGQYAALGLVLLGVLAEVWRGVGGGGGSGGMGDGKGGVEDEDEDGGEDCGEVVIGGVREEGWVKARDGGSLVGGEVMMRWDGQGKGDEDELGRVEIRGSTNVIDDLFQGIL